MYILFNDIIQTSDAPEELKSPALSDITEIYDYIELDLGREMEINCVGIGNTDGTCFTVNGQTINFTGNGLYPLRAFKASRLVIGTDAEHVGRIAAGLAVRIPTSVRKEPAFRSTAEPRTTLSGQVITGLGGYTFRTVSLDSRYKIDGVIMNEIKEGYKYIGMGYPFFINLEDEAYKLPFDRLYATDRNQRQMAFESGVKGFLYSRRWDFEERF